MALNSTIILADDLTGANDTAIQFVKEGLSALVISYTKGADLSSLNGYDVVAINSDSRGMPPEDAFRTMKEIISRLDVARKGYKVYKKIDSVLRGNPGQELAAIMEELKMPLALVAPSFPANRSFIEHGILYSGDGAEKTDSGGIDAVQVFSCGTERRTENISLDEIRKGADSAAKYINRLGKEGVEVFVADALSDRDLRTVYEISCGLDTPHVMAGAAGLAKQFARGLAAKRNMTRRDAAPSAVIQDGPVLIIAGTRQGETAAQIATISRIMSAPIIRFKTAEVAPGNSDGAVEQAYSEAKLQMKARIPLCIIAVESMFYSEVPSGNVDRSFEEGDDKGRAIARALGALAERLLGDFRFSVIISTGGDTSQAICRHLGVTGIEPIDEICPGIPLGRISGGAYHKQFIVTKSGRFGKNDSLLEIMRYLEERRRA